MYSYAKTCARSPNYAEVLISGPSLENWTLYMREMHVLEDQTLYSRDHIITRAAKIAVIPECWQSLERHTLVRMLVPHVLVLWVIVCLKVSSSDGCQIEFDVD